MHCIYQNLDNIYCVWKNTNRWPL